MYRIVLTLTFVKQFKKITKKIPELQAKVLRQLHILSKNPKYPSLNSHLVETRNMGQRWSSRVTGDIRIIWDYSEKRKLTINAIDIGGHSGKRKVYN